jgi:hypothetical protein
MKNITKLAVAALLGLAVMTTSASAGSITKGQKIYTKKIKGQCGDKIATDFTKVLKQKEWEEIYKAGKFEAKVREICPDLSKYKEKWSEDLFEFAYEYAADGEDLEC